MHEWRSARANPDGTGAGVSGMMKKLKRRLSWTIKGPGPLDDSLSELAEHLNLEDTTTAPTPTNFSTSTSITAPTTPTTTTTNTNADVSNMHTSISSITSSSSGISSGGGFVGGGGVAHHLPIHYYHHHLHPQLQQNAADLGRPLSVPLPHNVYWSR
ncbi:hypothetical protein ACOMHN_048438 [Nucella lapillus]